ncbi:hypothetical protein HDU76_003258, partial [Blyttiomyces sp. JEL0837]
MKAFKFYYLAAVAACIVLSTTNAYPEPPLANPPVRYLRPRQPPPVPQADDNGINSTPTSTNNDTIPTKGPVHINPPIDDPFALQDVSDTVKPVLPYWGGWLIQNVEVFGIYYGPVPLKDQHIAFYQGVTNSPWMDIMAQYAGGNQTIGRGTYIGSYDVTENLARHIDTWDYLVPFIRNLVVTGVITPSENLYVPVHFAPGIGVDENNILVACTHFCAFHSAIYIGDISQIRNLYFGVMVDLGSTSRCQGPCGWTTHDVAVKVNSAMSHEMAEAITDPWPAGTQYPGGWYQEVEGEIGDYCNAQRSTVYGGDGNVYAVQSLWSNADMACVNAAVNPVYPSTDQIHTAACDHDPYCRETAWDMLCLQLAEAWCTGVSCPYTPEPMPNFDLNYLGCFIDRSYPRTFVNKLYNTEQSTAGSWTATNCINAARAQGFRYVGLSNGGDCWADNYFRNSTNSDASEGDCNTPCQADSSQTCGGSLRLSTYVFSVSTPTVTTTTTTLATTTTTTTEHDYTKASNFFETGTDTSESDTSTSTSTSTTPTSTSTSTS